MTKPGAPYIPGEPATTITAADHLWSVPAAGGDERRHVVVLDEVDAGRRPRSIGRPMGRTMNLTGTSGPLPSSSPGLRAPKVTVRAALDGALAGRAEVGIEAGRHVHGEPRRARAWRLGGWW